jgi:uncharacterized protein (DUF488 family)
VILQQADVRTLIDVRAFPVSRRHPQFTKDSLAAVLSDTGIQYEWQGKALGGYRKVPYPEYMKTERFRAACAALPDNACVMCAETNPDECHRRHIADWLVLRGQRVVHLLAPGRSREHLRSPQEELWQDD